MATLVRGAFGGYGVLRTITRKTCVTLCYRALSTAAKPAAAAASTKCQYIHESSYKVPIPETEGLTSFLLGRGAKYGDVTAIVDATNPANKITYAEIPRRYAAAAEGFQAAGVRNGDVVAITLQNCPEYLVAFHGIVSLGAIVTTTNPLYTENELAHQLKDSGARAIVTSTVLLPVVKAACEKVGITRIFVVGTESGAFLSKLGNAPVQPVLIHPREKTLVIPYSSGTTGLPKGVVLTHHNLIANVQQTTSHPEMRCGITVGDRVLAVLPFQHIYGLEFIMAGALASGATCVSMPRFDPVLFLETLQNFKISFAPLVPPIIAFLAKHPLVDNYDLSSLHTIFSGAAPLDAETQAAVSKRLNGCAVRQGYGLTETSPVTHMQLPSDAVAGSVGRLCPNMSAKILDDDGNCLPAGKGNIGELCLRGPNVMAGYLNNREATEKTIIDGWLHTGDVGWVDERGNYYIVDRKKELIKVKGLQVAPAELEGILLQHPGVMDVAVVSKPDERAGELPVAFVVRRAPPLGNNPGLPGWIEPTVDELKNWLATRVAEYKRLADVRFVDAIPRAASGKILRRVLRSQV